MDQEKNYCSMRRERNVTGNKIYLLLSKFGSTGKFQLGMSRQIKSIENSKMPNLLKKNAPKCDPSWLIHVNTLNMEYEQIQTITNAFSRIT